jgi:hypothetical protein
MFKPNIQQMVTPIRIQHRNVVDVNGASEISYISEPTIDFCNWKGKGGTETTSSGALVVHDTAELTMWYRPNISERDCVLFNDNPELAYEITNVENLEMRNIYLIVKVKRAVSA